MRRKSSFPYVDWVSAFFVADTKIIYGYNFVAPLTNTNWLILFNKTIWVPTFRKSIKNCFFCARYHFKKREQVYKLVSNFQDLSDIQLFRSSRPEVFCKKDVLRNFPKLTGKLLCQR